MKIKSIAPFILAFVTFGCGMFSGDRVIYSSPEAGAMRTCATLADIVTPGVSAAAVLDLATGVSGALLGKNPADALGTCSDMLRTVTETIGG